MIIDLCFLIPCFPSFIDLLLSLGQNELITLLSKVNPILAATMEYSIEEDYFMKGLQVKKTFFALNNFLSMRINAPKSFPLKITQ